MHVLYVGACFSAHPEQYDGIVLYDMWVVVFWCAGLSLNMRQCTFP